MKIFSLLLIPAVTFSLLSQQTAREGLADTDQDMTIVTSADVDIGTITAETPNYLIIIDDSEITGYTSTAPAIATREVLFEPRIRTAAWIAHYALCSNDDNASNRRLENGGVVAPRHGEQANDQRHLNENTFAYTYDGADTDIKMLV